MPSFQYKAKRKNAETVVGNIFAGTKEEAVEKVHQLGLIPVSVVSNTPEEVRPADIRWGRVAQKELYLFTRQLTNLTRAGVPILRALDIIGRQQRNAFFRQIIRDLHARIQQGSSLSEALQVYPKVFNGLYVTMIRAGEESGRLKEVASELASYLKRQGELFSKVRTAVTYPVFMLIFGILTVFFILTYALPRITVLYDNLNQALPAPTVIVMQVSSFLINWWYVLLIAAAVLAGVAKKAETSESLQHLINEIKLRMPLFGELFLKLELSRFCRTMELLLASGVPITRALKLSIPLVRQRVIQEELTGCQEDLIAGKSFGQSLQKSSRIPEMFGQLISVGEESGSLTETMGDIAGSYEQDTEESIKHMTTLLEPLMIVLIGGIVGFIIFAMLLPIFQMDIFA